jgi:hypothetical protein
MPLPEKLREEFDKYCKRDIPNQIEWYINQFTFIVDNELRNRVGRAYYAARYMGMGASTSKEHQ